MFQLWANNSEEISHSYNNSQYFIDMVETIFFIYQGLNEKTWG